MQTITLYYRQGSSDKVYSASLEPHDRGYHVAFAYGRRNSTLQTGRKTPAPLPLEDAQRIFNQLIKEKEAKGYVAGADAPKYRHPTHSRKNMHVHPQLLNPAPLDHVQRLINDPAYCMQEKMDGRRLLVQKLGGQIVGINRLGLETALPEPVIKAAGQIPGDMILDGEAVGEVLWVFDLLEKDGEDLRSLPYGQRLLKAVLILAEHQSSHLHLIPTAFLPQEKRARFDELKSKDREGVVFKHEDAPYTAGRPASGGPQLKFKFHETASFIVGKVNERRSVSLMLFAGDKIIPAGNVTISPNHQVPQPGQVVECRYLYAFKESGSIYQPVYLGTRDDIRAAECLHTQLKYKSDSDQLMTPA